LWTSTFGARESIIGQRILLDDTAYIVIGVMPPSFKDPAGIAQLWRPMRPGADDLQNRSSRYWTAFGRLKPRVPLAQANAELSTLASGLVAAHPRNYRGWTLHATDLQAFLVGSYHTGLLVVLGAVGCMMLITCANLTGLAIVRAFSRRPELAVRTALGASRSQLVLMLLTEGLVLAGLGGTAGVLLATGSVEAMRRALLDGWLPRADEIAVNLPVLVTGLSVTVLTGLVSGIVPGLAATRVHAGEALKDSSRGSTGPAARRLRGALIVTEIALALILLAGTGLLARSFQGLMQRKTGVEAERVLSASVSLSGRRYDSPAKAWDYYSRAESAVKGLPGVEAAGFTQTSPFRWGIPMGFAPAPDEGTRLANDFSEAYYDSVGVDYFRAIGCPLVAGRFFTDADNHLSPPVIVLSETAARRYFGHDNPLGRHLTMGGPERLEVVGLASDVRRDGLATDAPLQVYRPLAQRSPAFGTLMVRTLLPPDSLARAVVGALKQIDADTPVSDVATLPTMIARTVTQPRLHLVVFSLFAMVALLLAGVGLYGLIAYSTSQRTREFGIRTALGATPRAVLTLVLGEAGILVAIGLVLGLVGALAAAQLLRNMVFATSLHDPAIFLVAALLLAAVAFGACLFPARRATRVNPLLALRDE
jgi:putative ABC transport system permease protein